MGGPEDALTGHDNRPYVGRFAPSPTGPLHFGSLVAAMASYVDARAQHGRWLIRIEDVDTTRCSAAAERAILSQLASYGFEHDDDIVRQSERSALYAQALEQLREGRLLFACACSRKQLEAAARNSEGEAIYPGTCRDRQLPFASNALRIKVPAAGADEVSFVDRAAGEYRQRLSAELGDFVLRRADGIYSYQLAVVVDDELQGVTQVVRGVDLLGNTPRQRYLQGCLGYHAPGYLHVPLVRNAAGEKLSKQTQAAPLSLDNALVTLREAWAFLRQEPLPGAHSVREFWTQAASNWHPERLCGHCNGGSGQNL
ncbi:MAG: tRNA glutamyl-Q(34) synthetase GluQRS [Burkholderiales bacterium]